MKVASNGIQIHVKDQGNGALPVVFLHYWGGSSRTWDDVIAAVPVEYRTIAPDLRGWGDSTLRPLDTHSLTSPMTRST